MVALKVDMSRIIPKLLIIAFFITFIFYRLTATVADTDLWGYLAFGRLFWERGNFPYYDVFSYVPTLRPWVYHEWLTGVIFYPLYQALGAPGLQVLKYVLGFTTLGLVYLTARGRGAEPLSAGLGVIAVVGLLRMGYSPVRAQVFTYSFFALSFYLLEHVRKTRKWRFLLLLIPSQMLWSNLHGGFLSGVGLIGLFAVGDTLSHRRFSPFWIIFLLSGMITLVNPYGLKYWDYITQAVAMPRPMITEWAPAYSLEQIASRPGAIIYFALLNIFACIWWVKNRDLTGGLIVGLTIYLGWRHLRHQPFFLIIFGAYFPDLISGYISDIKSRHELMSFLHRFGRKILAFIGLLITFLIVYDAVAQGPFSLKIPSQPRVETETDTYYPIGAIEHICKHNLSGNLLVQFNWSQYAIWELFPKCLVAFDGRFETVYPERVAKEYFDFHYATANWPQFVNDFPPDLILIDARSEICSFIRNDLGWEQIYGDIGCILFQRKKSSKSMDDKLRQKE